MKQGILLIAIIITSFSFSQDSTNVRNVQKPTTVNQVYLGETLVIENFKIKFIEVLQDSRCPKGVSCIWAGEVIVLIDLYEDGKKVERKKMTLNPKIELQKRGENLLFSEKLNLSVLNVLPYPSPDIKTQRNDYYLLLNTTY